MILSGKPVAQLFETKIAQSLASLSISPGLAVILVGNYAPSKTYVALKQKACANVGIRSILLEFPESTDEKILIDHILKLNHDPTIDGILVQFPLPHHINALNVIASLDPDKDIDGFHPINFGKLLLGDPSGFIPCTPLGIKLLLEHYQIPVSGKHVVIVGRGQTVGKPLAALLMQKTPGCNATVTVVHRESENLISHTRNADILVAAIGSPHLIKGDMIKTGCVVVDVGNTRVDLIDHKSRIVGDVDFDPVAKKCGAITPVPGGVGPMTVAMLLHNTWQSFKRRQ